MDREKYEFVNDLFDAFICLGIDSIPYRTQDYEKGVEATGKLFVKKFSNGNKGLENLFIGNPIFGDFKIFDDEVSRLLGVGYSIRYPFDNKIHFDIKNSLSTKKPDKMYFELAQEFCGVAGVDFRNDLQALGI